MSLLTGGKLLQQLQGGRRLLADGAVGSELISAGVAPDQTVAANLTHPQEVQALHRRASDAGAEILTSNTFGVPGGSERGWEAEFQAGVGLALAGVQEVERPLAVLLSVYPETLLSHSHLVLASFLEPETQDFVLLIETAIDLNAAVAAVELARQAGVTAIAATCHFQETGTMPDGTPPEHAVVALHRAGASIVGANCGVGPEAMLPIAQRMRAATDLPLLFQPNAGLPERQANRWIYPGTPERFAAAGAHLFALGAAIVGGCCGTTPAHIAALRHLLFPPQ